MILQNDLIEISHLTQETQEKFGVTQDQLSFINDLLYRCPIEVHNKVLDKLYVDGVYNVKYKLTSLEATKLINCIVNGQDFKFIEYNTPEWHKVRLREMKSRIFNDYIDYNSTNSIE